MCYVNMAKGTGLNYRLAVAVWPPNEKGNWYLYWNNWLIVIEPIRRRVLADQYLSASCWIIYLRTYLPWCTSATTAINYQFVCYLNLVRCGVTVRFYIITRVSIILFSNIIIIIFFCIGLVHCHHSIHPGISAQVCKLQINRVVTSYRCFGEVAEEKTTTLYLYLVALPLKTLLRYLRITIFMNYSPGDMWNCCSQLP